MKIELKNIKYAAFASHETYCFTASVYIDGVKAGIVENDGHGGSHSYHPWALSERVNDYAKTLDMEFACDEVLINTLMHDWLMARDLKNAIRNRGLFVKDGKIMQTNILSVDKLKEYLARTPATLNAMPFNQALSLYRELA